MVFMVCRAHYGNNKQIALASSLLTSSTMSKVPVVCFSYTQLMPLGFSCRRKLALLSTRCIYIYVYTHTHTHTCKYVCVPT